jgi:neutral trehalase
MNFSNLKYFNSYIISDLVKDNVLLDVAFLEDLYIESYINSAYLLNPFNEMLSNNMIQNDFSQLFNLNLIKKDIFVDNVFFLNKMSSSTFFENNRKQSYEFSPQIQDLSSELEVLYTEKKDESTLEYMRTIPDGKLYYPEPFIASPSFLHEEI